AAVGIADTRGRGCTARAYRAPPAAVEVRARGRRSTWRGRSCSVSAMRRALAGTLVFALAALAHLARLGQPGDAPLPSGAPDYVYDECYQAFTAHRYALGDPEAWNPRADRAKMIAFEPRDVTPESGYEWVHPPTAKLIMAAGIRLLGFAPLGYRLGSALAGLIVLFFVWRLGARLRGEEFGAFALLLASTDGMLFVM